VNYLFVLAAVLAAIHACTFACWLWRKGNTLGAVGVGILVAINLALPIYRIVSAS